MDLYAGEVDHHMRKIPKQPASPQPAPRLLLMLLGCPAIRQLFLFSADDLQVVVVGLAHSEQSQEAEEAIAAQRLIIP